MSCWGSCRFEKIQIERPAHEGSSALTGTALGDKNKTAYAPRMDAEEAGAAAQPLTSELQNAASVALGNTTTTAEKDITFRGYKIITIS